ncbi:MAG: putative MAPEG superfamily protein [Myxococcota bacterium]|jgi:uncharacterized MAPEG superfamily protein
MFTAVNALIFFTLWTLALVSIVVGWRSAQVLFRRQAANSFPAGAEHGAPWYWRCNRAHANCVENIGIFAALVLLGELAGGQTVLWHQLAWAVVFLRIGQTLVHVVSGGQVAVTARVVFFTGQVGSWVAMAILLLGHAPAAAEPAARASQCTATIRSSARMQAFKGKGEGPSKEAALIAGRDAACGTLPSAAIAHCQDAGRFKMSEVVATTVRGDKKGYEATVVVRELAPDFTATGAGANNEAACSAAIAAACGLGGGEPDCVDSGAFKRVETHSN